MTCCFVCGGEKAKWPINSKPNASSEPFFPFLDEQKPQIDTEGNKKEVPYIVCNVCYAFLIQQWNSYEENATPLSQRLYWMKRPRESEQNFLGDNAYVRNENDSETQSVDNSIGLEDESNPASVQESTSNGSEDDHSCKQISAAPQWTEEVNMNTELTDGKDKNVEPNAIETRCFICKLPEGVELFRKVHTRPQLRKETPFFPSLLETNSAEKHEVDAKGCIFTCNNCHDRLLFQWQLYTQRSIPFADRKYIFDGEKDITMKVACFVCGKNDESIVNEIACSKRDEDDPYFPFLKNLRKPPGARPINSKGTVKCCNTCTTKIFKKWLEYESAKIPVHDQLYLVVGKRDVSSIINSAPIPDEQDIVCFICQRTEIRKFMKEVYSNPYANMDLSFLEKVPKVPGTYYVRNLGQVLVCLACYRSLVCQWQYFDSRNISLDQREYRLQRFQKEESTVICEICNTPIEGSESCDTYIYPRKGDSSHPFFPCLVKYVLGKSDMKIRTCNFCSQNLILQWEHFERDCRTSDDRQRRNYRPHHFVCFLCSSAVHRSDIIMVNKNSYLPARSLQHQKPLLSVDVNGTVTVCIHCKEALDEAKQGRGSDQHMFDDNGKRQIKQEIVDTAEPGENEGGSRRETSPDSRRYPAKDDNDSKEVVGMKITATVPPLPSLLQRNQEHISSMQNQAAAARNDDEGSFAAALRKLAQQAIVPVARRPTAREGQPTPPSSFKPGSGSREVAQSPPRTNGNGRQSHSPFYSRGNMRPSSITTSSVASILPSTGVFDKDKPDLLSKAGYGVSSTPDDHPSRRLSRSIISGVIPRHETSENAYRQSREEGTLHHGEKRSMRESSDPVSRAHNASGIANGPSNGQMNILNVKDRSSNIGLVHPQPVRKLPDEDALKSGMISSIRSHPMESHGSLFRPPSPSDSLSRYQLMHGIHQHNSQGACPVHGHESGHHHGSPRDHTGRSGRLPFDGIAPRSAPLSEYRGIHPHHQRMRDELYGINRIPFERRDSLPNHMLEEDMRRRGYDWPWAMQHPLYENEQYRRHMVNGYRSNDHAIKEMMHGPHYISPHLYYPPEYPHMDPYAHPSMPPSDVYPSRYGSTQLSPRLYDYYRRERSLSERPVDRSEGRRQDSASHKLSQGDSERQSADSSIADGRSLDERSSRRSEISDYFSFSKERIAHIPSKDDRKERDSLENIIQAIGKKANADKEEPRRKMRIMEKLDLISKPYDERDSSLEDIVVKEEPDLSIQAYYRAAASPQRKILKERTLSENSDEISCELAPEDAEKKSDFMASIGLISHGKRRVLEEDYERKRWERKVAKMRGKPRKRRRREHAEESDTRPCSELDFYNGPMTRHKQQLLQEQEMLLEQVQKNHLERNGSKETNNSTKAFSDSSSPTNSSVTSTTPNSLNDSMFQTMSLERSMENDASNSYGSKPLHSFKPYKERHPRKDFSSTMKCDNVFSRENQALDGFVFGIPHADVSKCHWPGVDGISRIFADYENEREVKEAFIRTTCDKLKFDSEKLSYQRQQFQKEILALREKRNRLSENIHRDQHIVKSLFGVLRRISSN